MPRQIKENKIDTESIEGKSKDQIQRERKKLRNEVTHKLRFAVLERDKFTCHYCGRSPKTNPELELVVDHVIPIEAGGKNEEENLVTACWECNEGKKNKRLDSSLPVKVWRFNNQDILKTADISTNSAFQEFMLNPVHSEEREFLYQTNEIEGKQFCIKDCKACIESNVHFYRECFKRLFQEISTTTMALAKREPAMVVAAGSTEDILSCDFCYIATRCPKYKVGEKCAFNFKADSVDFSDTKEVYKLIAQIQSERVIRGTFFEKKDGGAIDKNVSSEIGLLVSITDRINNVNNPKFKFSMEAEGTGKEGTNKVEEMLINIFSGGNKEVKKDDTEDAEIIDETPES